MTDSNNYFFLFYMYNFSAVRQNSLLLTAVLSVSQSVCPSVRPSHS